MSRVGRLVAVALLGAATFGQDPAVRPPNLVFILADDLGFGEPGCYGQDRIRTPHIDRLAAEGMRLTQYDAGSPVCAPSRCTLLTGLHTGHAAIRDNDEMAARGDVWNDPELEGQRPLPAGTQTLGHLLQDAGYVTGAVGKWGLGWTGSSGDPQRQGFDHFCGFICQREAHNYYPPHLWLDGSELSLDNARFSPHQKLPADADPDDSSSFAGYAGNAYAVDVLAEDMLAFVREHAHEPFFLYVPSPLPHLALQVPEHDLLPYVGAYPETPYDGGAGYLPHPTPRAAYAAMISRLDADVGRLLDLLDELDLAADTLVVFSSDNGPSWVGGVDLEFFDSTAGLRGRKAQLYEGGLRVPFIARWPGRIPAGTVSDHVAAAWDVLPTFVDAARRGGADVALPAGLDGLSLLPTLLGEAGQQEHDYLYWEHARRQQALRLGDWKALRPAPGEPLQLYDLASDPIESTDVVAQHPDVAARIEQLLVAARSESEFFPLER